MTNNWQAKNVLILGAARQGQALARYLAGNQAHVILNDKRSSTEVGREIKDLESIGVELVLGEHPISLLERVDMVCLSGGIPLTLPIVKAASERGLSLTNDSQIFMEEVKAPVIGITGSAGKTTTTTLVGRIAQNAVQAPLKAWVGGNIGLPLVEYLDEIKTKDTVILELSSFQLDQMTISPHIAAVLNITPNHLDRHGTMEDYTAAKARILKFQAQNDIAILNREDSGSWNLASGIKGSLFSFGIHSTDQMQNGSFIKNDAVYLKQNGRETSVIQINEIKLRGQHNLNNVLAAVAICSAAGMPTDAIHAGISGFTGVEHRLEFVREWRGVTWINDTIATAPERTLAALESFTEPIILLLGGKDKNLPWDTLSKKIHQRVSQVILFGEASDKISTALGKTVTGETLTAIHSCGKFANALEKAADVASRGDIVLLSPGCTSYDAFRDFEERGNYFKNWVNGLP
jgi:UDP-N-acetylmuramoylalanine--D-glutamate ligase